MNRLKEWMKEWGRLPTSPSSERAWSQRMLHIICLCLIPGILIGITHNALSGRTVAVAILAGETVFVWIAFLLNRGGRSGVAAVLLMGSFLVASTLLLSTSGYGFHDPVTMIYPTILATAAVLLDRRLFLGFTGLTLLFIAGVAIAEMNGWIVSRLSDFTSVGSLIDVLIITVLTAVIVGLMGGGLKRSLETATANRTALAASYAELEAQSRRLRASEDRFRSTIELAVDGILLADAQGAVTDANTRACEMTGFSNPELIGRPASRLFVPVTDTVPAGAGGDGDLLHDTAGETSERWLLCRDGSRLPVELRSRRMPDGSYQFFLRDTTERRHLEDRLRQAQKMEAVGALAGGVAHDFNNFLTVMRGHLDLLGEDAGVTPAMQESLREMTHATERATELTRQLLAFSRRQVMQTRTLRLDELVAGISRMLERVLGEDIRLERAQGAQVPWVDADPSMMEQILMNLAVNARDAMPQGGRLVLETSVVDRVPEGAPAEASAHGERWACLRVSDSGSGMDAATLERAFEPFFTTKPVGRGTGLGLATVYGIVQQHRGWVEAESAVGKGTTFRVYLPLVSAPASPPAPSAAQSASRGGMETLLVVEDEEPVRRLAEGMLRRLGYQVLVAANGPQALRLWDAHGGRIQALFTDMVMPEGMTGFALALRLRESRPDLRVLIASGYSDQIVDGDLIRSSGISYLAKPYDLPTLAAALRRVLD